MDDVTEKKPITSVGEWLIDNYYVIEEQISLCERHLPKKYLLELPTLSTPGKAGIPRVYDLAEHIIAYGDGRVDVLDLTVFIDAYQEVKPLKLGELWAIPIMLRLALIENIRRMAVLAGQSRDDRVLARQWADELIRVEKKDPKNLVLTIADMARANPVLSGPFVAEFKRKLQGRGVGMRLPLQWVEQNLNEQDRSIEQTVNEENHIQAVLEISMRNCINSLRNLNITDWNEFVESMSLVERTLREDPAAVYSRMDFATRDDYRRVVEDIAKKSNQDEVDIARRTLELARAGAADNPQAPEAHVGYYLVGEGERTLLKAVGFRGGLGDWFRHVSTRARLLTYLGSIIALTVFFTAVTTAIAHAGGVRGGMLLVLVLLLAVSTLHLAVGLVNFLATQLVAPHPLPRMDYAKGIPPELRTLVVVPVIVGNAKTVNRLLRNLEIQYLNNRGDNIHFGLITDFPDAPQEVMPDDAELLELLVAGIDRLNARHPEDGGDNFFLFHRPRRWNPVERIWMGWERKRGKLEDLNRCLVGKDDTAFSRIVGNREVLATVKYAITLDADTQMSRDSAWQMVGAMDHPLVRPHYNATLGRVTRGHGILQPRVEAALAGANRSHYARMCSSEIGVDPYTRASSDVYQDLFDEGSFIGKGIYDVAVFDTALGGRFPDNKILSHDLLEGCVVRSGLISDVKVYEDPPATYLGDILRRHRWVRGDWQIASYLVAAETRRGFRQKTHPLNLLSQWKVFDNLRRSLTPIALILLLVVGLAVMRNSGLYLLVVGCVFLLPVLIGTVYGFMRKSPDKTFGQHLRTLLRSTRREAVDVFFKFSCLPYEAYVNADAIVRSLWRQCVSRRLLLQWNPFDNSPTADLTEVLPVLRRMWIGPAAAVTMTVVMAWKNPSMLLYTAPLFLLWLLSPFFTAWLSRPVPTRHETLGPDNVAFLRQTARRIWSFFEDFVTEAENWLPPDNYQEFPRPKIAHRTSPTNMGMALLSSLSAYDFGFLAAGSLLRRLERSLASMERLERYRGHFFNWYDTQTLRVLRPAYVSTVDSGNLAAHLMVIASGIRGLAVAKIVDRRMLTGLLDTVELALEEEQGQAGGAGGGARALRDLTRECLDRQLENLVDYRAVLAELEAAVPRADGSGVANPAGDNRWLAAFQRQCLDALAELDDLAPWVRELAGHPDWQVAAATSVPTLIELAEMRQRREEEWPTLPEGLQKLLELGGERAGTRLQVMQRVMLQCEAMADIDFAFLYDESKRMLSIGYNTDEHRLDTSFYDLLASESRLATYIGIAQNKLPQDSWWALGRMLTLAGRHPLLMSWSGSMFEYLMPNLVMPTYPDTLLDETCRACVSVQMEYGDFKGVPWGISESGYNLFDADQNYQYRAFGVPDLGLKHGLSEDLVIAPYASVMAAMVFPERACLNLIRMTEDGFLGSYGFYEAVDYTPSRVPRGAHNAIVRSYMAHHQGMSLVALGQALLGNPMHRRFEADTVLHSANLLLQEMVPAERALYFHSTYSPEVRDDVTSEDRPVRVYTNPKSPHPEVLLLSNGNYHLMVTNAGGGSSRWRDIAVTRWREDPTLDEWGLFCYVRDRDGGEPWSTTYQPTHQPARHFEAIFSEGKAEFNRRDRDFDTHTEIVVSPEDDVEVRRIRITNRTGKTKVLDLTSYAEVALAPAAADDSHQAFSKLFVETEIVRERQAIICSRRPSDPAQKPPLMFHMLAVRGSEGGEVTYETDRLAFLGRGNTAARPRAVTDGTGLGDSEGAVLDPVVAINTPVTLESGGSVVVDIITGVAEERSGILSLLEKYQDQRMADKAFDMAWSHAQLLLRQMGISETEAQRFSQLAASVIYANPATRAEAGVLMRNRKGQSGLWGYAISGDLPIVLLQIEDPSHLHLVNEMIQAHTYWRQKGLRVDLVIWNEDKTGYRQNLHDQIMSLAGAALEDVNMEKPGGIFLRSGERIAEEDRVLIQTVARVVLSDSGGMLDEQLRRLAKSQIAASSTMVQYRRPEPQPIPSDPVPVEALTMANGYGGFTADGREYVIVTGADTATPLPWVNVMANAEFGTVVSESGSAYTWSENAHEFRLTPWENDPVSDGGGEAVYLRDEAGGDYWSPAPFPCRLGREYVTRHGSGYTSIDHDYHGIFSRLTVHVDRDTCVKYVTLKVRNHSGQRRSLSATYYVEWVLGDLPQKTAMYVVTSVDAKSGALLAVNEYNDDFRGRIAFLDTDDPGRSVTGDRREFIGRNGSLARPQGLQRVNLSGRVGAGMDPCGAMQVRFSLGPDEEREIAFRLGVAQSIDEARKMIRESRGLEAARTSLATVKQFWQDTLDVVQVETPDQAFNFMANGWLLYQTLSCRFWGRSATYQSGGAIGYRDQLQDSLALLNARPYLVRAHLLECAAHQFVEGDVMHWWHPPTGRGVRTLCSDDYLWLPFVCERYITVTGDREILNEKVRFIQGRPVPEGEESYYDLPQRSEEKATLYEHCKRAIVHGLRFGEHGLPLMGSGDWNDGMDRVGREGRGESVWLGFFLHVVLERFQRLARLRDDDDFADRCREEAERLAAAIEANAWDGEWYRRAYFDDGTPLGSAENPECRIDSIAQSWAVLSGVGSPKRLQQAMQALEETLIDPESKIIKLFTPPFDDSPMNPGYIKGYVPGVRENGGQYTHAAVWAAMAFAHRGDQEKTWRLQELLNPVNHARDKAWADRYKLEPYVVAADIYSNRQHPGRGGWSWYTGSSSWLYRFMIESVLGFSVEAGKIRLRPHIPAAWPGFRLRYRHGDAHIEIVVNNARVADGAVTVNDVNKEETILEINDETKEQRIEVTL
ncbi:MAG: cyclic beta 1-2 glucan synthetase [Planctomycetes bacterium]|nr:cyclic beta 1-2 glucan synthetase [Planctomycetota bacterium]